MMKEPQSLFERSISFLKSIAPCACSMFLGVMMGAILDDHVRMTPEEREYRNWTTGTVTKIFREEGVLHSYETGKNLYVILCIEADNGEKASIHAQCEVAQGLFLMFKEGDRIKIHKSELNRDEGVLRVTDIRDVSAPIKTEKKSEPVNAPVNEPVKAPEKKPLPERNF